MILRYDALHRCCTQKSYRNRLVDHQLQKLLRRSSVTEIAEQITNTQATTSNHY